jgi:hypothetical protein
MIPPVWRTGQPGQALAVGCGLLGWMGLMCAVEGSPSRIFIADAHFHSPAVVAHPTNLPIQVSMVLHGFRPAAGRPGA